MSTQQRVLKDEILFNGGLDTDSDEKFVQQGDYMDARNVTKFYDGSGGVVVNIKGNEEITNSYLPVGTNKCIGWCEDDANNAIIFFNYNSNNNHGIYRYLKDSDTFQKILHNESILGFVSDCYNLQANVIGDLLYWNEGKDSSGDYINVPRKINIEKARNYTNSLGGDAYDDITVDTISAIKKPLIGNIYATLLEDASYSYNFLNATYYQFAIEVVFDDNEKSVLSNRTNFVYTEEGGSENYVGIRFYYDDVGGTVEKLNILYKESIISDFIYGGSIDVSDPSNVYDLNNDVEITSAMVSGNYYFYRFYGKSGGSYYTGTSSKLYDVLPVYANSQEYADNRIMYGGGRIGYDKTNIDIDFEVYSGDSGSLSGVSVVGFEGETYGGDAAVGFWVTGLDDAIFDKLDVDTEYSYNIVANIQATITDSPDPLTGISMTGNVEFLSTLVTQADVRDYILDNFTYSSSPGTPVVIWEDTGTDFRLVVYVNSQNTFTAFTATTINYELNKNEDTELLPRSYYQFCIFLFDQYFRTTGALINEDTKIYIPSGGAWGIEWTNNGALPSWVRYVSFGYSRCLDFYAAWQILSPVYNSADKSFEIPSTYSFVEGDVLRIAGIDTVYQIESSDGDYIYMDWTITTDPYTDEAIEILRPKDIDEESKVFYELSRLYTYNYTVRYIRGDIGQDNGFFVGGDFIDGSHLDSNNNLFYNFRRIIPELDDYGSIEYKSVYYSQKYFANTKINGLNRFDFDNREDVFNENGSISSIKRIGDVLRVYQRDEITSFYIGKTILKQSDGNDVVADTSQVLGGKRESSFNYGTVFGIARMDNYIFGYDIYKGLFWMDAYNGVNVISGKSASNNYKMDYYFKDKSKSLLSSGIDNINVLIGVDKPNEVIYVTFLDSNDSSNNETVAYHLPTNKWISKYSFIPEKYAWLDDKFFSFKTGKLYEHDSDDVNRCTFYGSYNSSYIQFISHALPNKVKIFNSIGIHSDASWSNDSIEIDPSTSYPNGMYTKVLDSEWIYEEGVQKCYMPRNMKTRTSTANNYDRINGEEMRGKVVKVKITNDDTDKVELFKVDINAELSR